LIYNFNKFSGFFNQWNSQHLFVFNDHPWYWETTLCLGRPLFLLRPHSLFWETTLGLETSLFVLKDHSLPRETTLSLENPLVVLRNHPISWKTTFFLRPHLLCQQYMAFPHIFVSEWLPFNATSAIFQLYHGKYFCVI